LIKFIVRSYCLDWIKKEAAIFDVEMAMDLLDDADKFTAAMLCSGDSDLLGPLE